MILTKEIIKEMSLKCDLPIWEEFALGLDFRGGYAVNNNFRGVRSLYCGIENTRKFKDIYIVTANQKSKSFWEFIKKSFLTEKIYKNVKISQYDRNGKSVYVVEFEYSNT